MPTYTYTKAATRISKLHDELLAAGITPITLTGGGTTINIEVAVGVVKATVDVVVAAHDPTTPSAAEQQQIQAALDRDDLKTAYNTMLTRLDAINNVVSPTNAQVIQAVKDLALYEKRILKVMATVLQTQTADIGPPLVVVPAQVQTKESPPE